MKKAFFFLLVIIPTVLKASPSQKDTSRSRSKYVPDFSAPAGAPYTAKEVRIKTAAGHILVGTLTFPKKESKRVPAVVTITGSSPQDRDHNNTDGNGSYRIFKQLADTLSRRGIAVLRMDDRGVGASTGDFWSATTPDRADDIREGIAYLRKHVGIDASRIALVGLSEGGMIGPLIASEDTSIAGIVLMAGPASVGKEILAGQIRYRISENSTIPINRRDSAFNSEVADYVELMQKLAWLRYFWSYDPGATARKVHNVPVLILQGTTDRNVPWTEAEQLAINFREAGNKNITVRILKNVNHLFLDDPDGNPSNYSLLPSFEVNPYILGIVVDWLVRIVR
jgi:pimeloyl-ACP methyl ester carboxylesterase